MILLQGRAAAISGAGGGIGRAHALLLAAHGAAVVVNDIDLERAQQVVAEIVASGGRALANGASIATRAGAEALVSACVQEFGAIDLLVKP